MISKRFIDSVLGFQLLIGLTSHARHWDKKKLSLKNEYRMFIYSFDVSAKNNIILFVK